MGRAKLKLQVFSNLKARSRYFERRKKSVEKAAKDLATLCGVQIGIVFYSPEGTTPTTWFSQPGALAALISSSKEKAAGNKSYTVSDVLKEKKILESEEGKLGHRAMEEEDLDRAGLVANVGDDDDDVRGRINMVVKGDQTSSLSFTESSRPVLDQEMWTYGPGFDCFSVPANFYKGMCLSAEPPLLLTSSSQNVETESLDQTSCSLNFTSGPDFDQEMWTFEQLSAANFHCYYEPANLDSSNGMRLFAEPEPPLLTSSSYNVETSFLGSFDFVSSEAFDISSAANVGDDDVSGRTDMVVRGDQTSSLNFAESPGPVFDQEMWTYEPNFDCSSVPASFDSVETSLDFVPSDDFDISSAASWFLNEERSGDRFISPVVLAS